MLLFDAERRTKLRRQAKMAMTSSRLKSQILNLTAALAADPDNPGLHDIKMGGKVEIETGVYLVFINKYATTTMLCMSLTANWIVM